MKGYAIIRCRTPEDMVGLVQAALDQGYEPVGGPFVWPTPSDGNYLGQAVGYTGIGAAPSIDIGIVIV